MVSIPALIAAENRRFQGVVVHDDKKMAFARVAARLTGAHVKSVYQSIQAQTKVPWFIVAVIHEREASQNFTKSIAQGDPYNQVSTHVPKGRGPFRTFEEAAYDALVRCAPKAAAWTDWSVGGALTILQEYNGLGYANKGVPSPYNWAGTNQYTRGKYVADGRYDATVVDSQLGCAGLLISMMEIDPTIKFGTVVEGNVVAKISPSKPAVPVVPSPSVVPDPGPSISNPAKGSLGDAFAHFIRGLFGSLHS
jgi:lysozyme family protein